MLDLAILGLLDERPLHGYELKKRLAELLGSRRAVSFGSLYPALNRLERTGAVEAVAAEHRQAPVPMTGSLSAEVAAARTRHRTVSRGQRNKKVYGITEAGRRQLTELLAAEPIDDRTFRLQVAFCGRLADDERRAVFVRRRDELEARLDEASAVPSGHAHHLADRYRRALRDRDIAAAQSELAWLDQLMAAEAEPVSAPATTTGAAPAATAPAPTTTGPAGPPTLSGGRVR